MGNTPVRAEEGIGQPMVPLFSVSPGRAKEYAGSRLYHDYLISK
jgi:hypothetical protein